MITKRRHTGGRASDPSASRHLALLTAEEERALALRARGGDTAARDELVRRNLPLVRS